MNKGVDLKEESLTEKIVALSNRVKTLDEEKNQKIESLSEELNKKNIELSDRINKQDKKSDD